VISFDTNILVYAVDPDAGERHLRSAELITRAMRFHMCLQPLQTFCEFFNIATRKMRMDAEAASALVEAWNEAVFVEPATPADLSTAMRGVRRYRLSFWDAMLWATVRRVGAPALISEDFQDRQEIEGVEFINPFHPQNDGIIDRLLPSF
jgi:predicted nucleic acid-binding protein